MLSRHTMRKWILRSSLIALGFSLSAITLHLKTCERGIKQSYEPVRECGSMPPVRRSPGEMPTEYDPELKAMLQKVVENKSPPDDPTVVELVSRLLDPPSTHILKMSRHVTETLQSKEIVKILKDKRKGFFLEVGGLDGERGTNTLWLENVKNWEGLLIEMDPYFYTMLRGHSRSAWSINCCLSPVNYTTVMDFHESNHGGGQLIDNDNPAKDNHAATKVVGHVPCFPLTSLMLALNRTHIDYFSLDIEGFEYEILQTVPWSALDISTFSIEYVHSRAGKEGFVKYMKDRGYNNTKDIRFSDPPNFIFVGDLIFVKQGVQ